MTTEAAALAEALRERLRLIGDAESRRDPAQHMLQLQHVSEKIEALGTELPPPVHPQLAHFLQRHSYDKALAFLEAEGAA